MSSAIRSLKFLPIGDSKDRQRYSDGEVFYDRQEKTLRVYDGVVKGGYKLATEQYVVDNQNLQDISSDLIPTVANTYNLGSPANPWKSLYVSTNTIYIGGVAVGVNNGNLTVGDDGNAVNLATEEYVTGRGFITSAALYWNNITSKPAFSSVATSGSYTDLSNKPTLFSGSYTDLSNKPTLFSGSYTDLTDKPTIPTTTSQLTNNSGFITAAEVGAQVQANWNQVSPAEPDYIQNKPAIPTNTNQLTNGAGFATETYVDTAVADLVASSPATLDTLNELAAALGDDPNFATTVSTEIGLKAPINNPTFTGTVSGITASMVGLGNVDNTSDEDKPVSTATQLALDEKANIDSVIVDVRVNTWAANSHTLTTADGITSESRCAMIVCQDTSLSLTGTGEIICPDESKIYIVYNTLNTYAITIKTSAGSGVTVQPDSSMVVFCDGTNVYSAVSPVPPRIYSITTATTISLSTNYDQYVVTALDSNATINTMSVGSLVNGQKLVLRITASGASRGLTWDSIFRAIGITLPTTLADGKTMYAGMIYNSVAATWDVVATSTQT